MGPSAAEVVTKSEFARRIGRTPGRVSQYVAAGMPVRDDGKLNFAEALAWVEGNTDPAKRTAGGARPTDFAAVKAEHETLKAERTRLQVERDKGLVVYRSEAEAAIFARARMERDAWANWAVRTAPLLAARFQLDEHAILTTLEDAVRDHLQELAETPMELDA
ncbi:hypothetical protein GCM10009099_03910 [Caenispirillum bisanense]